MPRSAPPALALLLAALAPACSSGAASLGSSVTGGGVSGAEGHRGGAPDEEARERAAYDRMRQPARLVAALGLRAGQTVADVGAGRGYLTFRLADAVGPSGRVVATDIDEEALAALGEEAAARGAGEGNASSPVEVRRVAADDPGVEPARYDLVLLAEVDHLLADREGYLRRLRRALAPGGRLAVSNRRLFRAPLVAAAARAGLRLVGDVDDLPAHFLLLFEAAP